MTTCDKHNMSGSAPTQGMPPRECEVSGVRYALNPDGFSYSVVSFADASISSLALPNAVVGLPVTAIKRMAFQNCDRLEQVTIPDSVISIGYGAFSDCMGITRVNYGGDLKAWCEIKFEDYDSNPLYAASARVKLYVNEKEIAGAVEIPAGTTRIGSYAFYALTAITSVTIPDSVTRIGEDAFRDCTGLQEVRIGAGVTRIGERAFDGCPGIAKVNVSSLKTWCEIEFEHHDSNPLYAASNVKLYVNDEEVVGAVEIPTGTTRVGANAFCKQKGITSITIPGSVTDIEYGAFSGCIGIARVNYESDLKAWCEIAFEDAFSNPLQGIFDVQLYVNDKEVTGALEIPAGTTQIGACAFCGLKGVTSVTIPDSVTSIGGGAFSGCSGLQEVTIPDSVTSISWGAFSECVGVTSITIPGSVTNIDASAFYGCTGITRVNYGGDLKAWCEVEFSTKASNPLYATYNAKLYVNGVEATGAVQIPAGTTEIGKCAFHGIVGITSIIIPDSVTSIGERAFCGCHSLTRIEYQGTTGQWQKLQKGSEWDKEAWEYTVHCTDGTVAKDGQVTPAEA